MMGEAYLISSMQYIGLCYGKLSRVSSTSPSQEAQRPVTFPSSLLNKRTGITDILKDTCLSKTLSDLFIFQLGTDGSKELR